jgi:type VI secretion system secreted protein VgrG
MANFTQTDRLLSVTTPLGANVLLLTAFTGREAMSQLFSYQLELFSEQNNIDPTQIVGKGVTWCIQRVREEPRYFNGFVSRFSAGGRQLQNVRSYRAEIVPWLWFLTRTADCRIFQNKTAPDIIKAVFDGFGFSDYKLQLRNTYPQREYCVQYRETAFNFVSRLMEQEGIFYFFQHDQGKHTLILADQKSAYQDCPESQVDFSSGSRASNHIMSWEHQYEFRSGKWAQTDYNFETPSTNLLSSTNTVLTVPGMTKFELFDYPGVYGVKSQGDARSKLYMEAEEATYEIVKGESQCCTFTPGGKFTLASHEINSEAGKSYVVASIQHSAEDYSHLDSERGSQYKNQFTCIPAAVPFRPARVTHKPVVPGAQTAVVVGPKGEEIYTDKYGRVKVQFFWDRVGKKDENSSCWVRVAEAWAGKNWGVIFNPRIGQEVVVEFLDGDPDRPLITGRVYNAEQMPPYALPTNQTQSVIKTRSSKEGGTDNFNELRFEDKKDSEDILFHAEKDFHRVVENDDDLKVGNNQTIEIKKDRTETVTEGNETVTIKQGNRQVTIEMGNETLQIKMGNQSTKLDLGKSETEAMQSIELKVGQSSVKLDQTGVTIKGMMIQIEGQVQTEVKGVMTQINGEAMLKMQGGITMIN